MPVVVLIVVLGVVVVDGDGCPGRSPDTGMAVICILISVEQHFSDIQWNLGIRDTQGTVKNCPEFSGGLISQVHFYVLNRPRD